MKVEMMLKTSIIITTHNYGLYLAQAIESALKQTVPALEVIVLDDNSSDNTPDIANKYDNIVKWHRLEFNSSQHTRNFGLSIAIGDYLLYLDADDYLNRDALESMQEAMNKYPKAKLVYCDRNNEGDAETLTKLSLANYHSAGAFSVKRLKRQNFISITSLIRKSCFSGFDPSIKRFQDWDAWLSLLKNDDDAKYIPSALFTVRIHGGNKTFSSNEYIQRLKIMVKHGCIPCSQQDLNSNAGNSKNVLAIAFAKPSDFSELIEFIDINRKTIKKLYLVGSEINANNNDTIKKHIQNVECVSCCEEAIRKIKPEYVKHEIDIAIIGQMTKRIIIPRINNNSPQVISSDKDSLMKDECEEITMIALNKIGLLNLIYNYDNVTPISSILYKIKTVLNNYVLWRFKK